jgi:hypothetical protein
LEQIPQQETNIFDEIQSYVDDKKLDDKISLMHQTSPSSVETRDDVRIMITIMY